MRGASIWKYEGKGFKKKKKGLNREVVLGEGFIHMEIMREWFQKKKRKKVAREECRVVLNDGLIHMEIWRGRFQREKKSDLKSRVVSHQWGMWSEVPLLKTLAAGLGSFSDDPELLISVGRKQQPMSGTWSRLKRCWTMRRKHRAEKRRRKGRQRSSSYTRLVPGARLCFKGDLKKIHRPY